MSRSDLATIEEITELIHRFYDNIRHDEMLGPVFHRHIHDWDSHLDTMVSFWSSLLLGAGTYNGTPMPKHAALPDLSEALFVRWLDLFAQTADGLKNQQLAERAKEMSERIARSLWFGYQLNRAPNARPQDLRRH